MILEGYCYTKPLSYKGVTEPDKFRLERNIESNIAYNSSDLRLFRAVVLRPYDSKRLSSDAY